MNWSTIFAVVGTIAIVVQGMHGYFGDAKAISDSSATSVAVVETHIAKVESTLSTLCNDYQQTVSRVDQNMQSIGKALKVSVVSGNVNADPCKSRL